MHPLPSPISCLASLNADLKLAHSSATKVLLCSKTHQKVLHYCLLHSLHMCLLPMRRKDFHSFFLNISVCLIKRNMRQSPVRKTSAHLGAIWLQAIFFNASICKLLILSKVEYRNICNNFTESFSYHLFLYLSIMFPRRD